MQAIVSSKTFNKSIRLELFTAFRRAFDTRVVLFANRLPLLLHLILVWLHISCQTTQQQLYCTLHSTHTKHNAQHSAGCCIFCCWCVSVHHTAKACTRFFIAFRKFALRTEFHYFSHLFSLGAQWWCCVDVPCEMLPKRATSPTAQSAVNKSVLPPEYSACFTCCYGMRSDDGNDLARASRQWQHVFFRALELKLISKRVFGIIGVGFQLLLSVIVHLRCTAWERGKSILIMKRLGGNLVEHDVHAEYLWTLVRLHLCKYSYRTHCAPDAHIVRRDKRMYISIYYARAHRTNSITSPSALDFVLFYH